MSILTEKSFSRFLNRLLVISPFKQGSVTGVGYDLTAGLLVHVDPFKKRIVSITTGEDEQGKQIALDPNTYVIVVSEEHVFLSKRLAGTFHSKSSLAAQAVYLNSTTCDPNWKGRLIFSLYNASGTRVSLDLDRTFATLCVHHVDRPSRLKPKDPKAVIEKYLDGLEGNRNGIFGYVIEKNEAFESAVDRARAWAVLPEPVFSVALALRKTYETVVRHWIAGVALIIAAAAYSTRYLPISFSEGHNNVVAFVLFVAACLAIWDTLRKSRGD